MRIKDAIAVILGGLAMILAMGLSRRKTPRLERDADEFDEAMAKFNLDDI